MKYIIIIGCSWAAGVWGRNSSDQYGIIDSGITSLFEKHGFRVINLSQPGSDLWGLIRPLECFLWTNPHIDIHKIYYIQTDIGRSFFHLNLPIEKTKENIPLAIENLYLDLYRKLDDIGSKYNKKISIIGGVTDVIVSLEEFKNLSLEVPSWCQLIDPELPLTGLVDFEGIEFLDQLFPDCKSQLLDQIIKANSRRDFYKKNKEWFYPDGKHPNVQGHRLLFERLIENV